MIKNIQINKEIRPKLHGNRKKLGLKKEEKTSRIELVPLSFKAIEVVSLLPKLTLELMDVLEIVLLKPLPLFRHRSLDVADFLHRNLRTPRLHSYGRHFLSDSTDYRREISGILIRPRRRKKRGRREINNFFDQNLKPSRKQNNISLKYTIKY